MVLDGGLARAGDEQQALHADAGEFFHHVLDHRLAADGQHLFRLGLGRGQKPRAKPGHGNDGNTDVHGFFLVL